MFLCDENGKLLDIPDEEQIKFCCEHAGVSESHARFILAMEKGEITGDKIIEPEDGWELIGQRATADNSIVVRTTETHVVFRVKVIRWEGEENPVIDLEDAKIVKKPIDDQTIEDTKKELLNLRKYFRICKSCQKRTHAGYCWNDEAYCMACASNELHILW